MMEQTVIYLIRHGQTERNRANVLQGRSDVPLNDRGRQQAAAAGQKLREAGVSFSRIYTSPLIRAVETAQIVTGKCRLETDPRLIEMDYGPYEGTDLHHPPEELTAFFRDITHMPAPAGMEPLDHVVERMGSFLEELRRAGIGGNILISTHAIAMKGALEYLTPGSNGSFWGTYIGNCAVYAAYLTDRGYSVPTAWEP